MFYCVTLETAYCTHCSRATLMTEFAQIVITFSDIDLSKLSKVLVKICCKQSLNVVNHVTRIIFNIYKITRKEV